MTSARSNHSGHNPVHHHEWPIWAGRLALIISALISLLTGISQLRAATLTASNDKLMEAVMQVHNHVRQAAGVPPLQWDDHLAARAADWARHLAGLGYMMHSSGRSGEGENIWMGTAGAFTYQVMVEDWASESRFFRAGYFPNNSSTGNWEDVGHFTQMVWRDSRHVGCGIASRGGWDFLVCRYDAPGNVFGKRPY